MTWHEELPKTSENNDVLWLKSCFSSALISALGLTFKTAAWSQILSLKKDSEQRKELK